ncbi:MAG: ABC transporter permease subunit [Firmicutes bacterium]|nr:ABC transporter permease subunit [Bacillota bacterium]
MGKVWTVARRELGSYFTSPTAYVLLAVFAAICGYFFVTLVVVSSAPDVSGLLGNVALLFVFIAPVWTMRLLSEERRAGTEELILTSPVSPWQWVAGKFLGTLVLYLAFLVVTLVYPLAVWHYGGSFDWHAMLTTYLGLVLLGAAFLSLGLWASSLSDNPVVAGMIGFGFTLLLWLADWLGGSVGGRLGDVLNYLAVYRHLWDFVRGVIDTQHLIYFGSLIFAGLFFAVRSIEARRWT